MKQLLNLGPPEEAVVAKGIEAFNREARCSRRISASSPTWSARS